MLASKEKHPVTTEGPQELTEKAARNQRKGFKEGTNAREEGEYEVVGEEFDRRALPCFAPFRSAAVPVPQCFHPGWYRLVRVRILAVALKSWAPSTLLVADALTMSNTSPGTGAWTVRMRGGNRTHTLHSNSGMEAIAQNENMTKTVRNRSKATVANDRESRVKAVGMRRTKSNTVVNRTFGGEPHNLREVRRKSEDAG